MVWTLIKKDIARLRVNWRNMLVLLAMPLCITALVGSAFGPAARDGDVPRIKLAIVNEDDNMIGGMLTSIASSEQSAEFLDTIATDREEAMRLVNGNEISAVLVVPADFSSKFLDGKVAPPFELIKNPAQSWMPAISEELMRVVAELLNAISQTLLSEVPEVMEILDDSGAPDVKKLLRVVSHVGGRFERAEAYLFPPIISIGKAKAEAQQPDNESNNPGFNIFSFVMPGLISVFLLFTADGSTRDIFTEQRSRTLDRYRTCNNQLLPFLIAKSAYSLFVVLTSAFIMLGGGALIFGIQWQAPLETCIVTISFAVFCTGFAFLLLAVIFSERLTAMLNTVVIMLIGFLGGSMIPSQNLPPLLRDTISPWMPNHIFAESIKRLQLEFNGPHWTVASIELAATGAVMLMLATFVLQRRMRSGALA